MILSDKTIFLYVLFFFLPLEAYTPRLLMTLGERCDFPVIQLAETIHARVITGSEKEMKTQITNEDLLDLTHLIILDAPVQNLSEFASKVFYDYIHLNCSWGEALNFLEEKIPTVPITDADLEKISPEERGKFYLLLEKVSSILNDHKISFWAISGTLLGAIRHEGMVPWDDDLDIIIRVEEKQKLESLAYELDKNGLQLFIYSNYYYKIFFKDGDPIYLGDGSAYPWKYPFLDIFTVNQLQDRICIVSHNFPSIDLYPASGSYKGWWLYPHEIQEFPQFCPFGPLQIPIPADAEQILTREYGPDWYFVAYLWHKHSTETSMRRIKVAITDYSSPDYVMQKEQK